MGTVHPKEKDTNKVFLSRGKKKKKKNYSRAPSSDKERYEPEFWDAGKDETDSVQGYWSFGHREKGSDEGPGGWRWPQNCHQGGER